MNRIAQDIKNTVLTEDQIGLWYLGQEGFVFKKGKTIIGIDLYLSDYVDRNCCQLVKWERLYPAPIAPQELDFLDAVLCTHSHCDHADPDTLSALAQCNQKLRFAVPAPETDLIASYGIPKDRLIPACADVPLTLGDFTVTPIPSAHETFHVDEKGNYRELGYILDAGCAKILHAGDMCMYDGLEERLKRTDIAMLPINGRDYFRNRSDIIGNFDSAEAILMAKAIAADLLIPMHHDLYAVNRVNPAYFVDCLMSLHPMQKFKLFTPGEKLIYQK